MRLRQARLYRAGRERCRIRRSRVVLTSRRWRQALRMTARRRWQTSPITGKSAKETV